MPNGCAIKCLMVQKAQPYITKLHSNCADFNTYSYDLLKFPTI